MNRCRPIKLKGWSNIFFDFISHNFEANFKNITIDKKSYSGNEQHDFFLNLLDEYLDRMNRNTDNDDAGINIDYALSHDEINNIKLI